MKQILNKRSLYGPYDKFRKLVGKSLYETQVRTYDSEQKIQNSELKLILFSSFAIQNY